MFWKILARAVGIGWVIGVLEFIIQRFPTEEFLYTLSLDLLASAILATIFAPIFVGLGSVLRQRLEDWRQWSALGASSATFGAMLWFVAGYVINRDLLRETLGSTSSITYNAVYFLACSALTLAIWTWSYRRITRGTAKTDRVEPGSIRYLRYASIAILPIALAALVWQADWKHEGSHNSTSRPAPQEVSKRSVPETPVIIVLIDTLRADHLAVYGYDRPTSPNIDAFAEESIRFEHAYTSSSWTIPSVATLFTGLYPTTHNTLGAESVLPEKLETLAEYFKKLGFDTATFTSTLMTQPTFGFAQGVDTFWPASPPKWFRKQATSLENLYFLLTRDSDYYRGYRLVQRAKEWLDARDDEPFYLYLHFMEPHEPYDSPTRYLDKLEPGSGSRQATLLPPEGEAFDPDYRDRLLLSYDGDVLYGDDQVGKLFAYLKTTGVYDRSMIWLVADHGEEFHEHGMWGHRKQIYGEVTRIPMMVKLPGGKYGGAVVSSSMAELVDVKATLESYFKVPGEPNQGTDILAGIGEGRGGKAQAFAVHEHRLFAVRDPKWTLMRIGSKPPDTSNEVGIGPAERPAAHSETYKTELYNRDEDPAEKTDLAQTSVPARAMLDASLDLWAGKTTEAAVAPETGELDEERLKVLRALGYVK